MKAPLSLRIEEDLLKAIQSRAEGEQESVNGFIEKLLSLYIFKNKYVAASRARELYEEHLPAQGVMTSDPEYLVTNGLDHMFVDDYYNIPLEKEDFVYECSVNDGNINVKQITKF